MVSSQSVNDIPLMNSFAAEVHKKHSKWRRGRLQASKHTPNAVKRFTEEENAQQKHVLDLKDTHIAFKWESL